MASAVEGEFEVRHLATGDEDAAALLDAYAQEVFERGVVRAAAPERAAAPAWLVWTALTTVYLVWGSTYLAIRVMVETMPALLAAGTRFAVAGGVFYLVLRARRGAAAVRFTRPELLAA